MNENKDLKKAAANEQENEIKNQSSRNSFGKKFILLQMVPVILSNDIKNTKTNALLISREVWSKLKLNGAEKKLYINNALSKASAITRETVTISISSVCIS